MKPGGFGRRIVVVGVGNAYRGDDGIGRAVAHHVQERLPQGSEFCVVVADGEGTRLMEAWSQADAAILIDAMQSGVSPGTMRRLDVAMQPLPDVAWRCSTHAFGVAEAIALSRVLQQLPPHFVIYGIEGERFETGTDLSAAVARAIPEVVDCILHDLDKMRALLKDEGHA